MDRIALTALCGEAALRWWRDPATGEKIKRPCGEILMLAVTELAEAMEGHRKSLADTHLPQYPMLHVELADTNIRLYDTLFHTNDDFEKAFRQGKILSDRTCELIREEEPLGGKLLIIVGSIWSARKAHEADRAAKRKGLWKGATFPAYLAASILMVESLSRDLGFDLEPVIQAKLAYNATREDHSDAARLAANGKKY